MARQEQANDVFALTSFLYGGNADYIEELYAKYEDDPNSVDPQWRDFFAKLGDNADDVKKNAEGASSTRKLADCSQWRTDFRARWQLG